jgi:nitroreductase
MLENPVIKTMLNRKSIRRYTEEIPSDEVLETIVRAGQQAPFASQLGSLLLSRDPEKNKFKAPLLFTICVDVHKWELIMAPQVGAHHGTTQLEDGRQRFKAASARHAGCRLDGGEHGHSG